MYIIAYVGTAFAIKREIDVMILAVVAIVCFLLNYIIYSILEKISNE